MRPFDPPSLGSSGFQIEYDERCRRYLDCLAVDAVMKGEAYGRWMAADRIANPVPVEGSNPPETTSRAALRHISLCDVVGELGMQALDPGLDVVRRRLELLPAAARVAKLRKWLLGEDRVAALTRTLMVRADRARTGELFDWPATGLDPTSYWKVKDRITSPHMVYLLETADFGANELLRILYLLAQTPDHLRGVATAWRAATELDCDPNFPTDGIEVLRRQFVDFKYWFDDPFRCSEFSGEAATIRGDRNKNGHESMKPGMDMTYWSENHRLLFGAAEYLAGQFWPDEMFVSGRNYRKEGPNGAPRPGDVDGRQHRERGAKRVRRWLDERLRLGFAEWNAPGYYVEDILPILNLVDFAVDDDIQQKASMVMDLLVFDLAINHQGGATGGSAGRAYFEHKNCVWEQSVGDACELLFGTRHHFVEHSNGAVFLATSPRYRPPDVLIAIASTPPTTYTSRGRVSINFGESGEHGVGFTTPDDMEFWWSRAAYATKQTIIGSRQVATDHGLLETPPFKQILPMIKSVADAIDTVEDVGAGILGGLAGFALGGPVGAVIGAVAGASEPNFTEVDAADMASVLTEGSVLSRANLYSHHCGGALLASVQNFRPGQLNFQSAPCVATLSNGAMVWTSYPSAGSHLSLGIGKATWIALGLLTFGPIGGIVGAFLPEVELVDEDLFKADEHDGPNWWTGNVVQPRVTQRGSAAIVAYEAKELQRMLFGTRTHAWFPRNQFDETRGPVVASCNHDTARWFCGRAGDSYVGLLSALETTWTDNGPWKDKEIRAEGPTNVFITQVGDAAVFGSFDNFVTKVSRARVHISGLHSMNELQCSYDVPLGERLELHYEGSSRYGGQSYSDDDFPRIRNPFARVSWLQDRYIIQHAGKSVIHDVLAGERTLGGHLDALVHQTPLTVYSQNMALLPEVLYKGEDTDGALAHLVRVLRERQPDIVGLSEMWTEDDRLLVVEELSDIYPFWTEGPHDPLVTTPIGDVELMGGGLLLLSKHPIVSTASTVYRQCSGDDCLSNKGVLHARLESRGHPCTIDAFVTHTQAPHPTIAGTTHGARVAVEAQIRHLAAFVRASRDPTTPAILMGDFNVDWYGHRDLYDYLVATLGNPVDASPMIALEGRERPAGTSESDDDSVSSFHEDHVVRDADDPRRFGPGVERLDYIFSFPGVLYSQHLQSSRVVVEQWRPGRDMSDHYGIEETVDTTAELLPADRAIVSVTVTFVELRCLQTTSGPGSDEVGLDLSVRASSGALRSRRVGELDDVDAGDAVAVSVTFDLQDPGERLLITASAREIDSLSADDSLGLARREFDRTELLAMAGSGKTRVALPMLGGDGAEYVVELSLTVEAPEQGKQKAPKGPE